MKLVDDTILDEMVRRLVDEFNPEQIILFGSRAWGEPDQDSNVDLLVVISDSAESPLRRAQRAHLRLADVRAPKDVLVNTRAELEKYRDVYASLE